MPEMPDVVSGEAVASAWGNDIRDRTVQRYADAAARDAAVPLPVTGDVAWLDAPNQLTVFDGSAWLVMFTTLGGDVGPLTVTSDPASGADNHLQINGPTSARFGMNRQTLGTQFRVAVSSTQDGIQLFQWSTDGTNWVTAFRITQTGLGAGPSAGVFLDPLNPQLLDQVATRRVGLFTTFSVWSHSNSHLRLRVGADDTTSYLMRLYDRAGAEDAIYSFTETGIVGPTSTGAQVNYAEQIEALQAQVTALQAVVDAL